MVIGSVSGQWSIMIDRFRFFCLLNPCFILALVLAGGMAVAWRPERPDTELEAGRSAEVVARVARPPQVLGDRLYVELQPIRCARAKSKFPIRAVLPFPSTLPRQSPRPFLILLWPMGKLCASAALEEPPYYAIPGVEDYRDYFWQQGMLHRARLKSPLQLHR